VRLLCLFSTHNIWDSGNSGWKRYTPCRPCESIEIDVLFYRHNWGEPCLTQTSILKWCNNFVCGLRLHWKLFAQSTSHIGKVTVARNEFGIQHRLTLKINQFIFIKHFEKTNPCPDKIHMFSYVLQNYFQVF